MKKCLRFPVFWETGQMSDEERGDITKGADAALDPGSIQLLILAELKEINRKFDAR